MEDSIDDKDREMMAPIAAFIAARLTHTVPRCNAPAKFIGRSISTINIDQYKQKFWYVRIYCMLADPELVQQRWLEDREHETDSEEPPIDFVDKCFMHDARHYRSCYMDMLSLLPERLHQLVAGHADYSELLYATFADLEKVIDDREARDTTDSSKNDTLRHWRNRYNAETNQELKDRLRKIYEEGLFRRKRAESVDV